MYVQEEKGLEAIWASGGDGKDLSRGQWQRVAVARAFLGMRLSACWMSYGGVDPIAESRMYEILTVFFIKTVLYDFSPVWPVRRWRTYYGVGRGKDCTERSHEQLMQTEGLYRTMYLPEFLVCGPRGREGGEESGSREKDRMRNKAAGKKTAMRIRQQGKRQRLRNPAAGKKTR